MTASVTKSMHSGSAVGMRDDKKPSMRSYPEYKDSRVYWLGVIPSHWKVVPCRAIVRNLAEKNEDGSIENYLSLMANVGVIPYEEKGDVGNKKPDDLTKCKIVKKGNLVINSMNYAIGSYGMSPYDGVCSPVYIVLGARESVIERRFALRVFENKPLQKHLALLGNGILAHRAAIKWDDIKSQYVALPPLDEQAFILAFLDRETARIDNLIAEKQNFINLLKEKRQALISHVVTKGLDPKAKMKASGIKWIGEVPEHWGVGRVKHLASIISKGTTPSTIGGEFVEEGVRFLKAENIGKSFFVSESPAFYISESVDEQLSRSRLKDSDVLVIIAGATTGKCSVITADLLPANTNQAVSFIRPKCKAHSFFIAYWLESKFAQDKIWQDAVQAAQPNLSMEDLGNLNITIPPDEEVDAIVSSITSSCNRLENLENETLNSIELLKEHRTALISAAVTGKIDVRDH